MRRGCVESEHPSFQIKLDCERNASHPFDRLRASSFEKNAKDGVPSFLFLMSALLACLLTAPGLAAGSSGAGENSGLRPDGAFGSAQGRQPRAAVPTRALPAVDAAIEQAIHDGSIPGAVLIVGHDGRGDLPEGLWGAGFGAAARSDDFGYGV